MCTKVKEKLDNVSELEKEAYMEIKNGVSMKTLSNRLHLSTREVRKIVENLRLKGFRIGSSKKGYYLCETDAEYRDFEKKYLHGAYTRLSIANAMRNDNEGQVVMYE